MLQIVAYSGHSTVGQTFYLDAFDQLGASQYSLLWVTVINHDPLDFCLHVREVLVLRLIASASMTSASASLCQAGSFSVPI